MTTTLPLPATAPTSAAFTAIGTRIEIQVTEPRTLIDAVAEARDYLRRLDEAVSRFREDSEVSRLAARAAFGPTWTFGSQVFADALAAGLRAARLTDGLVTPTVGAAVVASGYDADLDAVRSRDRSGSGDGAEVPPWHQVTVDQGTGRICTPAGVLIDLGATAKGFAADTVAGMLAARLPGGFLINLGGDIAVSGTLPIGGWRIGVQDAAGSIVQTIVSTGQAVATSSTQLRTWSDGSVRRHHIIDPRTGRTARTRWAQVTCVGASALEANAASTAAVVLGDDAPEWLSRNGIPARLDDVDGTVTTTPGWPEPTTGEPSR